MLLWITSQIENQLKNDFVDAIQKKYNQTDNSAIDKTIDEFQERFECCGYNDWEDWKDSQYWKDHGTIPRSCCKDKNNCRPSEGADFVQKVSIYKIKWLMK